jgi:hypothetical protein
MMLAQVEHDLPPKIRARVSMISDRVIGPLFLYHRRVSFC